MYERFYQLRERPFALSPDPEYLYPSRVHQEALDYLRYGLESQAGFVVITGEIGSGKTTLLQTLLRNLDTQTTVGRIVNTMLEPRELLETIAIDFGLDSTGRSKPLLLRDLSQFLVDQRLAGRQVLLVIDEAQNLGLAALEELRMLSNLETEKSKLLQIVLVGQPDLRDKLAAPALEQLRQRITVSYHLRPLDAEETHNYINHRLRRAALGVPMEFPGEASAVIHDRSRGVPRVINVICDATLVFGYAEERRVFDRALLADVLSELEATGVLAAPAQDAPASSSARPPTAPSPGPSSAGVTSTAPAPPPSASTATAVMERPAVTTVAPPAESATPPFPALSAAAVALEERERAICQREIELAEQRRVLAEEYRLLRAQRQTPLESSPSPSDRRVWSPVESPARSRVEGRAVDDVRSHNPARLAAADAGPVRFDTVRSEGFWDRVKRIMLGVSAS
jgi:putative secretion ATPase (PEP-CTERM system associated)